MVRYNYTDFEEQYAMIRQAACGRQACSVLILVAMEVDAMAATKMLTQLLRSDNVGYLIRAVSNFDEIEHCMKDYLNSEIKSVFLINCGAIYDIPKSFDLEKGGDMRVFILDNHRPIHLKNIYSKYSVVVFDETEGLDEDDDLPSVASDLLSINSDSDSDLEDEENEEGDEDEEDEDEEGDAEFDTTFEINKNQVEDEGDAENENEDEENEDAEDEAEDVEEQDENDENDDEGSNHDEEEDIEEGEEGEDVDTDDNDDEDNQPRTKKRQSTSSDVDRTMINPWSPSQGQGEASDDEKEPDEEKDDNNNDNDDDDFGLIKRKRKIREVDIRKHKKQKVLQYYRKPVSYTAPTSLMLLPFVKAKFGANGHPPLDVMWQAILGITDQYQRGHISEDMYESFCFFLKNELGEHLVSAQDRSKYIATDLPETNDQNQTNNATNQPNNSVVVMGAQTGHIEEVAEYRFYLFRHWSIYEAMFHSVYIASKFPVWNSTGLTKLQELLAEMGVPLQQCKQAYQFMTPEFRQHFRNQIQDSKFQTKYNLMSPEVTYKSFCRFTSYKNPLAAGDIVQAATALLELYGNDHEFLVDGKENEPPSVVVDTIVKVKDDKRFTSKDAFFDAYSLIGTRDDSLIKKGIHVALDIQRTIFKKASAMLDGQDSIHKYHRIYYAYIRNNASNIKHKQGQNSGRVPLGPKTSSGSILSDHETELIFGRPMVLARLGQYIMEVKRNLPRKDGGWTGTNLMPLILLSERQDSTYLVMGISPFSCAAGTSGITEVQQMKLAPLVNFKQFFKLASKDMGIKYRCNSFDPNVIEIHKDDTQDFLGALNNALRKATPNFTK